MSPSPPTCGERRASQRFAALRPPWLSTMPDSPPLKQDRSFSVATTLTTNSLTLLKTSTRPTLDELKLAHILNGETCPPIAFPDFASFVSHKEFTTENLLFVIWYRSYKARFDALDAGIRERIPVPSTSLGDRLAPFAYLDNATSDGVEASGSPAARREVPFASPQSRRQESSAISPTDPKANSWNSECQPRSLEDESRNHASSSSSNPFIFRSKQPSQEASTSMPRPILAHQHLHPSLPPAGTQILEAQDQPMRDEAQRAFATFLRKSGSRELGISDDLRQFARIALARSTAPEVFLPVYEEIYQVIETQSLPHFLTYAKSNINRPKQLFWYMVGTADFLIGVAIYLILTLLLSRRHFGYRAIRLPSTIFTSFGAMQFYSAARGFCSQVWGRRSRQVRPWEMDVYEGDEEAALSANPDAEPVTSRISRSPSESGQLVTLRQDKEMDLSLPHEVHPLADLGGTAAAQYEDIPWATAVPVLGAYDAFGDTGDDEEMSEVQRRQLAIRRSTIKIPDASLAFPIPVGNTDVSPTSTHGPTFPFIVTPPTPVVDSVSRRRSEITPFEFSDPLPVPSSASQEPDRNASTTSVAEQHRGGGGGVADLSALLSNFALGRPTPTTPQDSSHGSGGCQGSQIQAAVERRVKVFGPERLVEDPRVKALYDSVIRDILIVGGTTGVVWIALCLAVPVAGLV